MPRTTKIKNPIDRSKTSQGSKGILADFLEPDNRLVFQYNPPQLVDSKEVNWVEVALPGADDSLAQFGSGQNLTLELQLFFNVVGEHSPDGEDDYVERALRFLHTFTETRRTSDPSLGKSPGLLIFIWGATQFGTGAGYGVSLASPGLVVRIASLSTTRSFFDRQTMSARRAMADLTLKRHVNFPR